MREGSCKGGDSEARRGRAVRDGADYARGNKSERRESADVPLDFALRAAISLNDAAWP